MKLAWFKRQIRACYFRSGLLALAVCFLPDVLGLAQAADTRIAFMSNRHDERNGEIYLMNSDGKRVRRLTEHPQFDAAPAWSPNGQKITFKSFRDEHRFLGWGSIRGEIYVMNPDGANPINLTQSPERGDGVSAWSPDGKQIVFYSAGDIWIMDANGKNPRNLTNHDAGDWDPDWSPDGTRIAFSSDRNSDWEFDVWGGNSEVYIMATDGANPINITKHPAKDNNPDWSPDGTRIAFSSDRDGNREVYAMNADGTNPINLTNHPADDRHPDWSSDGRRIAFSSNRDGDWEKKPNDNWEVYAMNADGSNPINLTNHPKWDSQPAWELAPNLRVDSKERLVTLWGKVKHVNTYNGR